MRLVQRSPKAPPRGAGPGAATTIDNTDRLGRAIGRFRAYSRQAWHATQRGVDPVSLLRTQFPFLLPDAVAPSVVTLELTNRCNVQCTYCENRLRLRPRGFMSDAVFDRVVESVADLGIRRVRLVGNGEPTLHPCFLSHVQRLTDVVPYVSVLSNGQWRSGELAEALLRTQIALIEFSVDGMEAARYESTRAGASFERLLRTLDRLQRERRRLQSTVFLRIRVMLRPSEKERRTEIMGFWRKYVDTVVWSPIVQRPQLEAHPDAFRPRQTLAGTVPRCAAPLIQLGVNWNGDVPLCSQSSIQIGAPGLILGNVLHSTLRELWQQETRAAYGEGHRRRDPSLIPMCRGCMGH